MKRKENETYSIPFFPVDVWIKLFSYLDINGIIAILRVSKGLNSISIKSILSDYSIIFDHVIHNDITTDKESLKKLYILFSNNFVYEEDNESLETDLNSLEVFQKEETEKHELHSEKFTGKNLKKLYMICSLDLESHIENHSNLTLVLETILMSLIKLASLTLHEVSIKFNFFLSLLPSHHDKKHMSTIKL
jgi:hypothetical protein